MHRVDLPDGAWADLRDPEEVTVKGKRGITVIAAGLGDMLAKLENLPDDVDMDTLGLSEAEFDAMMRMSEATIVAMLAGWSFPEPLPTLATVGDMPASRFAQLEAVTAKGGAEAISLSLNLKSGDTPDPKDRSGSSEPSNGLLKAESEPSPIQE